MIVPMKKMTLVALKSCREEILAALQRLSAVQLIAPEEAAPEQDRLSRLESRVQRLEGAAGILKPYAPKGGLGPKPEFSAADLAHKQQEAMELCEKIEKLDRDIAAARSEKEKKRGLAEGLKPWAELDCPLELVTSTNSAVCLGGIMPPEGIEALKGLPVAAEVYGGEKDRAVIIACERESWAEASSAIRAAGFQEVPLSEYTGTALENINALERQAAEAEKRQEELTKTLAGLGSARADLDAALDGAVIERDREAAKLELEATEATFLLTGWVREDKIQELESTLNAVTDAWYADYTDPTGEDCVPTALKNSRLITPYEAVTNLYSLPVYGTVDGTPLMAPFYFIFFGMMLSDTVYGAVLALLAWLFIKKVKPDGMMGNLASVLFMGGLSTMVMGLLFGTFAGVGWPVIFKGTPIENVFPLIDSSADPVAMLGLCAAMGIVHMFYAVFIAAGQCIRRGDWAGAIVDNLCWVVLITGLLLLGAPMLGLPQWTGELGKWMAIASAATVLLFAGRANKKLAGRLMSGAGKLYDVTSWLGDVLSYARIFALGLSTGVIGLVLNTLCWDMLYPAFKGNVILMVLGFVLALALSLGLHLFMMAISTLGCFVHTARLQYVEFFGKFYTSGGKAFRPLGYRTKNVRVTER